MSPRSSPLSFADHRRDRAGLEYVYPVLSRRAGGVSIGINLNTNNACNWRCSYCQVEGLVRGKPPSIDLERLRTELDGFVEQVVGGHFTTEALPPETRRLADVAFSGNGEPTASVAFPAAVDLAIQTLARRKLLDSVPLRLITNGSMVHRMSVRNAIRALGEAGGEVWFKVDRASEAGIRTVNGVRTTVERVAERLRLCASAAPTWIQTCWFGVDGEPPGEAEEQAFLALVGEVRDSVQGVLLYGIARRSMQPGSERLTRIAPEELEKFGARIRAVGLAVRVTP